ncbi:MAG: hypothetical protein AB8W37_03995 [Arsenophonus endosymbiont of Dermacentor nuttalli]
MKIPILTSNIQASTIETTKSLDDRLIDNKIARDNNALSEINKQVDMNLYLYSSLYEIYEKEREEDDNRW